MKCQLSTANIPVTTSPSASNCSEVIRLDNPFNIAPVYIDTGILISRFGYSFITVDIEGETIARVPFRIFQTDAAQE